MIYSDFRCWIRAIAQGEVFQKRGNSIKMWKHFSNPSQTTLGSSLMWGHNRVSIIIAGCEIVSWGHQKGADNWRKFCFPWKSPKYFWTQKIVKMIILGSSPTISININSKVQIFHILTSFYEGVQNVEKFLLQTPIFFAVRRDKEVCFLHRRC